MREGTTMKRISERKASGRNYIAKDLRTSKYKSRVVKSKIRKYQRGSNKSIVRNSIDEEK
tara:strand:- start:460 stop:639 length:180 start_codon:yes stop_codon:yes gene_type:complete